MANVETIIAKSFLKMAEGLENGSFADRPKIVLTGMGSEHGEENAMAAAKMAASRGVDVYYIGTLTAEGVTTVPVADEEEGHKKMEQMVESGEVDGAVTLKRRSGCNVTGSKCKAEDLSGLCRAEDAVPAFHAKCAPRLRGAKIQEGI